MNRAKDAAREFYAEADAEAARLIKAGVPPWTAMLQASRNVSARRQANPERITPVETVRRTA